MQQDSGKGKYRHWDGMLRQVPLTICVRGTHRDLHVAGTVTCTRYALQCVA